MTDCNRRNTGNVHENSYVGVWIEVYRPFSYWGWLYLPHATTILEILALYMQFCSGFLTLVTADVRKCRIWGVLFSLFATLAIVHWFQMFGRLNCTVLVCFGEFCCFFLENVKENVPTDRTSFWKNSGSFGEFCCFFLENVKENVPTDRTSFWKNSAGFGILSKNRVRTHF